MPRRSAAVAAQTRAGILAAARELFTERGYAATTTAEIAARAGVTVGALFHHFEGKLDLFRAVFRELDEELDAHARASARRERGLEALLAGFRAFLEFARRPDYHRIVMVDGPAVLGDAGWHQTDSERGLRTVSRGVEGLIAAGAIPPQPVTPLAVLLLGAMDGAGFAIARGEPGVTARGCVAALERLLRGR